MIRQSLRRNQRTGGWNVKHVLQICLLIAFCAWLLYQVKHSHDKNKALEDSNLNILDILEESKPDFLKLGRKDPPHDLVEIAVDITTPSEEEGNEEAGEAAEQENKEGKNVEEEGKGAGDESIDENDQESADEVGEDADEFVDEEEKGGQLLEDLGSSSNHAHEGADENTQGAVEEHYKADDASSTVARNAQEIDQEDGNFGMGNLDEKQKAPRREELENDGRTNMTGSAPKDDELHDVPTDSVIKIHNTTSFKDPTVVDGETDVGTLPNSTILLEFGGRLGEHDNTTSESNEHMDQQHDVASVKPNVQIEQHSSPMESVSDEQMQTHDVGRGEIAETGDSSHESETIDWNSAQEDDINVKEIRNAMEASPAWKIFCTNGSTNLTPMKVHTNQMKARPHLQLQMKTVTQVREKPPIHQMMQTQSQKK